MRCHEMFNGRYIEPPQCSHDAEYIYLQKNYTQRGRWPRCEEHRLPLDIQDDLNCRELTMAEYLTERLKEAL